MTEMEAPIRKDLVSEISDWSSLWADLLQVQMTLHGRDQLAATAANLFARRSLWEGAVVAYGRTALSGSRQLRLTDALNALGPDARACHDEIMRWRNKHVAHRQDKEREMVSATAVVDIDRREILGVRVRVSPLLGPEDEESDLIARFQRHVEALKDYVWMQRLQPLESGILQGLDSEKDALMRNATLDIPGNGPFTVTINPSDAG